MTRFKDQVSEQINKAGGFISLLSHPQRPGDDSWSAGLCCATEGRLLLAGMMDLVIAEHRLFPLYPLLRSHPLDGLVQVLCRKPSTCNQPILLDGYEGAALRPRMTSYQALEKINFGSNIGVAQRASRHKQREAEGLCEDRQV